MKVESIYSIDWLSFTVFGATATEIIEALDFEISCFEVTKGKYGYDSNLTWDGLVNLYYHEDRPGMGVHVELTGQGCRKFEVIQEKDDKTWHESLAYISKFARFSRIDIAFDEFEGVTNYSEIIRKIDRGEHVGRCRSFKIITGRKSNGESAGTTIYMGSNKSDVMIRVYEKNYERQVKGYEYDGEFWNRWELVLKHEKANNFISELLSGYSIGGLFKAVMADTVRFVDPKSTDKNKRRWPVASWWAEFLEGIEPVKLRGKEYQPNLAKTLNWVEHSAITSLKGISTIASRNGVDFLKGIVDTTKVNEKRLEEMLTEFDSMSDEDKRYFLKLLSDFGR